MGWAIHAYGKPTRLFAFVFMNGEYWGEFTAFGDIIVMMSFMVGMFVVLRKHFKLEETPTK